MSANDVQAPPAGDFTARLADGFFRRWFFYLVPVALFAAIGVYSAQGITGDYASYARLSATANPYVEQAEIRGTDISFYESPAGGTARLIDEQLQTDAFINDVAARAGLADALDDRLITRDDIRTRLGASGSGRNNITLSATWDQPETALLLVEATITAYTEFIAEIAVTDSDEAVQFWSERRQVASTDVQQAEQELSSYVAQLPPLTEGQVRSTEQVLEIERLNSSLDRAREAERAAQSAIDEAEFAASQALSSSSRQLQLIDAPEAASAPEPVRRDQAITVAMFSLLGLVVGFGALILGTAADRTVRSQSQLAQMSGIDDVVVIPRIRQLRRKKRKPSSPSQRAA